MANWQWTQAEPPVHWQVWWSYNNMWMIGRFGRPDDSPNPRTMELPKNWVVMCCG